MSEDKSALSEELLEKLKYFIEDINALRVSRNLRRVFFDYLRYHHDNEPTEFEDTLDDVENMIELLEVIEDEKRNRCAVRV